MSTFAAAPVVVADVPTLNVGLSGSVSVIVSGGCVDRARK
eukprot:CAMPEP_0172520040 /NCGR_PEP_ID=MMETSP1066-20121228/291765_1 /TAXON_ID=671091 /ORGANISM="Coscinodiscus wailesii, Strain CCMP2513" /LENGTH=39 /DNA_ID= /DNA_START= /DNA_END= /DNA_ORIENTATION=